MAMEKQSRKNQLDTLGQDLLAGWQGRYAALSADLPHPSRAVAGMLPAYRDCLTALHRLQAGWLGGIHDLERLSDPQLPWHWLGGWEMTALKGTEVGNAAGEGKTPPALRPLEKHSSPPTHIQQPFDHAGSSTLVEWDGLKLPPVSQDQKPVQEVLTPAERPVQVPPSQPPATTPVSRLTGPEAQTPGAEPKLRYQPQGLPEGGSVQQPLHAATPSPLQRFPAVQAAESDLDQNLSLEGAMPLTRVPSLPPVHMDRPAHKDAQPLHPMDLPASLPAVVPPASQPWPKQHVQAQPAEIGFRTLADLAAAGPVLTPPVQQGPAGLSVPRTSPQVEAAELPQRQPAALTAATSASPPATAQHAKAPENRPASVVEQPQEIQFRGLADFAGASPALNFSARPIPPAMGEGGQSLSPGVDGQADSPEASLLSLTQTWAQLQDLVQPMVPPAHPAPARISAAPTQHPPAPDTGVALEAPPPQRLPPTDPLPTVVHARPSPEGHWPDSQHPAPLHLSADRLPLPAPEFLMEDMLDHLAQQLQRDFQRIYGH